MITISLCMIVKNEENVLGRCLDSVQDLIDEIIIVDTGSSDRTKQIASQYTSNIYDFEWIDDFSAARNYSFSQATTDYVFWMDADDMLLDEDKLKLMQLKRTLEPDVDVVMMKYNYAFDGDGNVTLSFYRERLLKRNKFFKWIDPIHEYIGYDGNIITSNICITHKRIHSFTGRNLKIFEKMVSEGKAFSPRNLFYFARELYHNGRYEEAISYYHKFLDTGKGWVENNINACLDLSKCYKMKDDKENALKAMLKSLEYAAPRAEICCELGYYYKDKGDYKNAIIWFKLATQLEKPEGNWGFVSCDYWGYIPNIELCVCFDKLGNIEEAIRYNNKAAENKPNNASVLQNKKYYEWLLNKPTSPKNGKKFAELMQKSTYPAVNRSVNKKKLLGIVQVAPNFIPVPPKKYGGIERVVYDLTEGLVKRGHEVYLYAAKGSISNAKLIPYEDNNIDIAMFVLNTLPPNIDLIHDHTHPSLIGTKDLKTPTICTIHDSRYNPVSCPVYLSARALQVNGKNEGCYVYNGINPEEYEFSKDKEDYLLFMGELRWHKGIVHALEIAERTNRKLIIAGPVYYPEYFENEVKPRIDRNKNIQYIGEVGGHERQELFKKAQCMLFPTSWEEPFGLVMIEAMACGTPVVALANGAVPEVLSGFPELVCQSVDEMVEKVLKQPFPAPEALREYVINNFTTDMMVERYLDIYTKVLGEHR